MIQKIGFILIGILLGQGMLKSQTSQLTDTTVFTLGFSTYLSHTDKYASDFDIYADSEGFTYVSGNTRDQNFPATAGAYQTKIKGEADVFVVKYTPEGEIVFATLIGGTKREHHSGIAVDNDGYIYVAGGTHSADFPVTEGSYDTSFNGEGAWAGDVFVTKLNSSGSEIVFSTFIGGVIEETLGSGGIQVDSKGNVIIAGTTRSGDFPFTKGTVDQEETQMHGFISKFSPDLQTLLFSTFFGSSPMEGISQIDLDDQDNIYLAGSTYTANLPVTDNAFRKEIIMPKSGGITDHYIARIDGKDHSISYFSYFAPDGYSCRIKWTKPNRLLVSGSTSAESFPVTEDALCKEVKGSQDCMVSIFNTETMTLEYASLFGGSEVERVLSANFLNQDTVVIGGITSSADLPMTDNALYSEFPVCEKSFNSSFLGRKKSFVSVIDVKNSKLLYSSYYGAAHLFRFQPDRNGNLSFVAEAGQKSEAGITGFPVTKNAVEPPSYTMIGRLLLNARPEPTKAELYKDVIVENAILETYVGEYEVSPGVTLSIRKYENQLKVQVSGQNEGPIYPRSQIDFFINGSEVELTFNINDAGEVESVTVHPDGGDDVICMRKVD